MAIRTRTRNVTFRNSVSLKGMDRVLPPGTYTVETDEGSLEQLSFTAYQRVATSIRVPTGGNSYQIFRADSADLENAEKQDEAAFSR